MKLKFFLLCGILLLSLSSCASLISDSHIELFACGSKEFLSKTRISSGYAYFGQYKVSSSGEDECNPNQLPSYMGHPKGEIYARWAVHDKTQNKTRYYYLHEADPDIDIPSRKSGHYNYAVQVSFGGLAVNEKALSPEERKKYPMEIIRGKKRYQVGRDDSIYFLLHSNHKGVREKDIGTLNTEELFSQPLASYQVLQGIEITEEQRESLYGSFYLYYTTPNLTPEQIKYIDERPIPNKNRYIVGYPTSHIFTQEQKKEKGKRVGGGIWVGKYQLGKRYIYPIPCCSEQEDSLSSFKGVPDGDVVAHWDVSTPDKDRPGKEKTSYYYAFLKGPIEFPPEGPRHMRYEVHTSFGPMERDGKLVGSPDYIYFHIVSRDRNHRRKVFQSGPIDHYTAVQGIEITETQSNYAYQWENKFILDLEAPDLTPEQIEYIKRTNPPD